LSSVPNIVRPLPPLAKKMRRLLSGFVLFWLSYAQPAHAQFQRQFFWWGCTAEAVHDSLRAQGYWQEASLGDQNVDTPDTHIEAFTTIDYSTVALFNYYQGVLAKRTWRTDKASKIARLLDALIADAYLVAEHRWLHTTSGLIIERNVTSDATVDYILEPDWDHLVDKQLRATIEFRRTQAAKSHK